MRRACLALALIALAAMCLRADEKLDPAHMKALGFVPYRQWWVTPERRAELIASLPSIVVRNELAEAILVSVDGGTPVEAPAEDGAAVPVTVGAHKVRLAAGRRVSHPVTVQVKRGFNTTVEVIDPDSAPSVIPRHERPEEGDDDKKRARSRSKWRTEKSDGYEIRYYENEPKRAVIRYARTREGNIVLGLRRPVRFDEGTWRMREGALVTRTKTVLVETDRVGVMLISDPKIDAMIYSALFRVIPLEDIPLSRDRFEAIVQLGAPEAFAFCQKMLDSDEAWARRAAAEGFADLGSPKHVPMLLRRAQLEKEDYVKEALDKAAAALEARGEIDALVAKASKGDDRSRMAALDQLREKAADVPLAFYRDVLLKATNTAFREIGMSMLAQVDPETSVPLLVAALKDKEASVRKVALQSLGMLKALEATAQIVARLEDEFPGVRSAAAAALMELGVANAIPALLKRLKDDNKWVRNASSVALATISAREGIVSVDASIAERARVVAEWTAWWTGREPAAGAGEPTPATETENNETAL